MNNLTFFLLVFLVAVALSNPITHKLVLSMYPEAYAEGHPRVTTSLLFSLILSLLVMIVLLSKQTQDKKENFFFEVSQPQPKCERGYYGKNVNFEYTQPGNQIC